MIRVPEHAHVIGAVTASVTVWLIAAVGVVSTASSMFELGWGRSLSFVVLCGSLPSAMWTTRRVNASLRLRTIVPSEVLQRRYHGSLDVIVDTERRPLRSIGSTAHDVAVRTGALLTDVVTIPGVRIFLGTRPAGTSLPPLPHMICAGRTLILVESVAWPAGAYVTTADGRIHCDGVYIGQSTNALMDTARAWQASLKHHRVTTVVVVHPVGEAAVRLPARTPADPAWVLSEDAVHLVRRLVAGARRTVSRSTIATLLAGTADRG